MGMKVRPDFVKVVCCVLGSDGMVVILPPSRDGVEDRESSVE